MKLEKGEKEQKAGEMWKRNINIITNKNKPFEGLKNKRYFWTIQTKIHFINRELVQTKF